MFPKCWLCLLLIFLSTLNAGAQDNVFSGTWEMVGNSSSQGEKYTIRLQIGRPERDLLYPSQLTISSGSFSGVYDLLLVKKSRNQLAIGRNKVPQSEYPFSLGSWTVFLNGIFKFEKNKNNTQSLVVQRIASKRYGLQMPELTNFDDSVRGTAMQVRDVLREDPLRLVKINSDRFEGPGAGKIIYPWTSDAYFGIMDSIELSTNAGHLSFSDNNKIDNDTVSVTLNGRQVIEVTDLSKRNPAEDIVLDTGLNILVFFADNYGRIPPNTGKLNLNFGKERFAISFANKADLSATFIVAKLYYHPKLETKFSPELMRNTKLLDSFHTNSGEVRLAIWDDALEDGDSISLNLNGQWLVKGFSVTKKPQFLTVNLVPGVNNIIFVADNLGAIPPNTSLLEIIDGKQRKSFSINTDLKKNNLVKITYDYQALE